MVATYDGIPDRETAPTIEKHFGLVSSSVEQVDFPNAYYQVSDVRMHVPFVHPIESYDQALMRQIEQGDIQIYHSSWSTHTRNIPSTSKQSLAFQERALSLKGALAVMRNSPAIRDIQCDMAFPANGIEKFQWKIGSEYIPAQEVDCKDGGNRALAELRKGLGLYDDAQILNNITEASYLPIDLPNQLETGNVTELFRGASEPSNFMMALDLEKSPGQASGFDSAASSVDIELLMTLRSHSSLVGTTTGGTSGGGNPFKGAVSTTSWQPTKYRVNSQWGARTTFASNVPGGYAGTIELEDVTSASSALKANFPPGTPEGIMLAKGVTTTHAAGAAYSPAAHQITYSEQGVYSRVYFFAHIDQVLRLSALGRMEIVR